MWELENNKTVRPSADKVIKIAEALGVTAEFLVDDKLEEFSESDKDKLFFEKYKASPLLIKKQMRAILSILTEGW